MSSWNDKIIKADTNPDLFLNLIDTVDVAARVTKGEEREHIWAPQKAEVSAFAEYEQKTARQIPVVVLARAS
jgi:F420H(2)-dependent quinone reductase